MTVMHLILLESDALLHMGSNILVAETIQKSSPSPSVS